MQIDKKQIITMTEANQNFCRAVKIADKFGSAVIYEDEKPQYMLVALNGTEIELTDEEKVDIVARRILKKYRGAFEELAK